MKKCKCYQTIKGMGHDPICDCECHRSSNVPMGVCHKCNNMFPADDLWGNIATKEVRCDDCQELP